MSVIATLLGGGLAQPIEAVGNILDDLFTSDEEKLDKEALLARLAQQPALVQAEINKVEAQHRSVFVAGWRPFIGWVCGAALAWHFLFYDVAVWVQVNFLPHTTVVPALTGTGELITVLMALLGLGTLRTVEKIGGKAR